MISSLVKLTAAAMLCGVSFSASAFDNSRQGFFFSVGGGVHGISAENNSGFGTDQSESAGGFATSFKIGGGISEQFSLYYIRNASWFKSQVDSSSSYTVLAGISGIGGSYYLQPSSPSAYVMGAIGIGDYDAPFATNIDLEVGGALLFGAGYEFSKHKMLEASMLFVDTSDDSNLDERSFNSLQLTFNYMWY